MLPAGTMLRNAASASGVLSMDRTRIPPTAAWAWRVMPEVTEK